MSSTFAQPEGAVPEVDPPAPEPVAPAAPAPPPVAVLSLDRYLATLSGTEDAIFGRLISLHHKRSGVKTLAQWTAELDALKSAPTEVGLLRAPGKPVIRNAPRMAPRRR
jgi:hypothetical protein